MKNFDNFTGQVNFAAGTLSNFPSGTFTLATITFRAHAETGGTSLTFNAALPRLSTVSFAGAPVLTQASGGTVTVEDSTAGMEKTFIPHLLNAEP